MPRPNGGGCSLRGVRPQKTKRDACRRAKLRCSTSKGDMVSSDPMTVARTSRRVFAKCKSDHPEHHQDVSDYYHQMRKLVCLNEYLAQNRFAVCRFISV
jgi:hypothetical protein